MTRSIIFIAPSDNGYEFSGCDGKINAKLLALMAPSTSDLIEEGGVSPVIRANWASKGWLLPRSEILLMVGLRASIPGTPSYRGSNSIWAAAKALRVKKSPTSTEIRGELTRLANEFMDALSGKSLGDQFPNTSHKALARLLSPADFKSLAQITRDVIELGGISSPFFK